MTVNRQAFAMIIGLVIVAFHIGMMGYLQIIFHPQVNSTVAVSQITMPLTVAYSVSIVSWFLASKGLVTSREQVGWPFVILVVMVVGGFLVSLPFGLFLYLNHTFDVKELNTYFSSIESGLGGMFVLIFNSMFERNIE